MDGSSHGALEVRVIRKKRLASVRMPLDFRQASSKIAQKLKRFAVGCLSLKNHNRYSQSFFLSGVGKGEWTAWNAFGRF